MCVLISGAMVVVGGCQSLVDGCLGYWAMVAY